MAKRRRPPEQAGVIAFRRRGEKIAICLIRKADAGWGIPKGLIERGDTQAMTAVREAWEEAGIRGRLAGRAVGVYEYEKWGERLRVAVYLLDVRTAAPRWPEDGVRRRQWVSYQRARVLLRRHPVHPLLTKARARILEAG